MFEQNATFNQDQFENFVRHYEQEFSLSCNSLWVHWVQQAAEQIANIIMTSLKKMKTHEKCLSASQRKSFGWNQ